MNQTVKLTISGACVALGVVLPIAFHSIPNAGSIFLPMHIRYSYAVCSAARYTVCSAAFWLL